MAPPNIHYLGHISSKYMLPGSLLLQMYVTWVIAPKNVCYICHGSSKLPNWSPLKITTSKKIESPTRAPLKIASSKFLLQLGTFSSNRPTGPILSSSRIVCLCVCLMSPFHVLDFEAYFAPTSWSQMSNIFRASESLGKSAGKKWFQNWKFLLGNGLKLQRKKRLFFADFSLQIMVETTLLDGLETSGQRIYR